MIVNFRSKFHDESLIIFALCLPVSKYYPCDDFSYQLQTLFARLCLSRRRSVSTRGLTASFGNFNSFEQHDAQELCRKLFEHLEDQQQTEIDRQEKSEPNEEKTSNMNIDNIFSGTVVNYLESCDGLHSRQVPEKFLDLEVCFGCHIPNLEN